MIKHLSIFILSAVIAHAGVSFTNGDFEASTTALSGWTPGSATVNTTTPIAGAVSATIATAGATVLSQDFGPATTDALSNFTLTLRFRLAATPAAETNNSRIRIRGEAAQDLLTISFDNNAVRTFAGTWADDLTGLTIAGNTNYWLRITGISWDTAGRSYEIAFSTNGTTWSTKTSSRFHTTTSPAFGRLDFDGTTNGITVDNIVITDPTAIGPPVITIQPGSTSIANGTSATLTVTATGQAPLSYQWYQGTSGTTTTPVGTNSSTFVTPALTVATSYWVRVTNSISSADSNTATVTVAAPDKIVRISGVYPHLAMTNNLDECGVGAVVPWAGKLWAITYGPHMPNGSTDKLYEINTDLSRVIRPESVGGTPANRFIHSASNQLNIGPYFIDSSRNVRVLKTTGSSAVIPGRLTATAAHLTDPNRLYIFTMENGVYDVNTTDLSYITRYPDVQGTGDSFLAGYHGKGAYTGQGRLIVGNNGEANQTMPSGVLATWDGTVQGSGTTPNQMVAWNQVERIQTCEVTGPGGITGNPNPATDPVWTTGFDAKSVVLHTYEGGVWKTWRLPKASYTHDGAHGWHTEWPRIRQLDPTDPNSIYLMHMHGLFYNFPKTFSSANFAGLTPISSYYKMPVDYCMFNGQLVMGKNDTTKFSNALVPKAESNLWFGQLSDLQTWGAPTGHGAVWMNESVTANQTSDPFLIQGFPQRTLHLKNNGASAVSVEIQTSAGTPNWTPVRSVNVPAGGYVYEMIGDLSAPWLRLKVSAASSSFTAFCHTHTPYPHHTPASATSDEFAALADIRDTKSISDGVIRVMDSATLPLEFASSRASSSGVNSTHRYHRIGGDLVLTDTADSTAEATLRTNTVSTQPFGADAASAWVIEASVKYRLPKTDPLYDTQFSGGWARGLREVVTERQILNCHGTFYEVPRDISGGMRKMRALVTHGKRITDFASWRGLLVLTGVLDDAPASDKVVKNADGTAALWLGEVDDLWRMGEPRGKGGPWKDSAVTANTASDPYLMYGYDRKELTLSATAAATITVELDFLGDNTWSTYQAFGLSAGQTINHLFPTGFHAHWVRVKSSTTTTATAQFTYGPADTRDAFLDWARDHNIPTGSGRDAIANLDEDGDGLANLLEFLTNGSPSAFDPNPISFVNGEARFLLRNLQASDATIAQLEFSSDLSSWATRPADVVPAADQGGVPSGFTRHKVITHPGENRLFMRLGAR